MAHEVIWTKEVYDEFVTQGMLSPEELDVFRTRVVLRWKIDHQSIELGMSKSKINEIIKELKKRYDEVQVNSSILKPRMNLKQRKEMERNKKRIKQE